jgi:hypothetical protein
MIKQKNSEKMPSLVGNQGIQLGSYGAENNNCSSLQKEVI